MFITPTVGFILVTYNKPEQILRLVNTLNRIFDFPPIVCHHDFAQSNLPVDNLMSNFKVVHPHHLTSWGSFSVIEATLSAITLMYKSYSPDWFILLSAADYPIKSASKILQDLATTPYDVHIDNRLISYNTISENDWNELCYERYCSLKFRVPFLNKRLKLTKYLLTLKYSLLTRPLFPFSRNFNCFAGEHWFCANRKAANYLLEFHNSKTALASHYRNLEPYIIVPEESYYQTVFCNAQDLKVSKNHWRYIDWSLEGSHPKTLMYEDLVKIQSSSAHFARKFDIDKDIEILNEIDRIIG